MQTVAKTPAITRLNVTGGAGVQLAVERSTPAQALYPPLVFVHGIGVSQVWWTRQVNSDLVDEGLLVTFDLRGHGASDKPTEPAAYQESQLWADDLHAVIQTLGLERPIVCSWSYGALVVCDYLRCYGQETISGLAFVDGNFTIGTQEAQMWLRPEAMHVLPNMFSQQTEIYREGLLASLSPLLLPNLPDSEDALLFLGAAACVSPATWQAMFSRQLENSGILRTLHVPVLLIHGERDQIFTPKSSEAVSRLIPHARLQIFSSGHAPFYEQSEAFNQTLAAFRACCAVGETA